MLNAADLRLKAQLLSRVPQRGPSPRGRRKEKMPCKIHNIESKTKMLKLQREHKIDFSC